MAVISFESINPEVENGVLKAVEKERCVGELILPADIKAIGDKCFKNCSGLVKIAFAEASELESIGKEAFYGCTNLKEISVPDSVSAIGYFAFFRCSALIGFKLPSKVERLGNSTFQSCEELKEFSVLKNIRLGHLVFAGCRELICTLIAPAVQYEGDSFKDVKCVHIVQDGRLCDLEGNDRYNSGSFCCSKCGSCLPGLHSGEGKFTVWEDLDAEEEGGRLISVKGELSGALVLPDRIRELGEGCFKEAALREVVFGYGSLLKSIGEGAFQDCRELETLNNLPAIKHIGKNAFCGCRKLEGLELPAGLSSLEAGVFCGCERLSIDLSRLNENIDTVGKYALAGTAIRKLVIPKGVKKLEEGAFRGCKSLNSVQLPGSLTSIGAEVFAESAFKQITVPEGVEKLEAGTFRNCQNLSSIELPSALKVIGAQAFADCVLLESLSLPVSLRVIEEEAFSGCGALKGLKVPALVQEIGENAFKGLSCFSYDGPAQGAPWGADGHKPALSEDGLSLKCEFCGQPLFGAWDGAVFRSYESLQPQEEGGKLCRIELAGVKRLFLPDCIEELAEGCFKGGETLEEAVFAADSRLRIIGRECFAGCKNLQAVNNLPKSLLKIEACAFINCEKLQKVTFNGRNGIAYVGEEAFKKCISLEKIDLFRMVTSIRRETFTDCKRLSAFEIPEGAHEVEESAFSGCESLRRVNIPSGMRSIKESAFADCKGLQEVVIGSKDTVIDASAFKGCRCFRFSGARNDVPPNTEHDCDNISDYKCGRCGSVLFGLHDSGKYTPYEIIVDDANSPILSSVKNCSGVFVAPDHLTVIDRECFKQGKRLTEVIFGAKSKLIFINESAFERCAHLTKIVFPKTLQEIKASAFSGCEYLRNLTFPGSVKRIGAEAFSGCIGLNRVIIENKRVTLGEKAFAGAACACFEESFLEERRFDLDGIVHAPDTDSHVCRSCGKRMPGFYDGVKYCSYEEALGDASLRRGCFVVPDHLTSISRGFFKNNSGLREVLFSADSLLAHIEESAFEGCVNLQKATFPKKLAAIDASAFKGCRSLQSLTLPTSLQRAEREAFSGCTALNSVKIENRNVTLGEGAFAGVSCSCFEQSLLSKLAGATIGIVHAPGSDTHTCRSCRRYLPGFYSGSQFHSYEEALGSGALKRGTFAVPDDLQSISKGAFRDLQDLTEVVFREESQLVHIEKSAFENCGVLRRIVLPSKLEKIEAAAFQDCVSLQTIEFAGGSSESSLNHICSNAFKNCRSLQSLVLPASLQRVETGAFGGCKALREVRIENKNVQLELHSFEGVPCFGFKTAADLGTVHKVEKREGGLRCSVCQKSLFGICASSTGFHDFYSELANNALYSQNQNISIENNKLLKVNLNSLQGSEDFVFYVPDEVEEFGANLFENTNVTEVVFSENSRLKIVGNCAFANCKRLERVILPASLEGIAGEAFANCEKLDITVPVNVKIIEKNAFLDVKHCLCSSEAGDYLDIRVNWGAKNLTWGDNLSPWQKAKGTKL